MSTILTESYIAFGTYNGNDAFDAAAGGANQARAAYALNLARAGYPVYMPANTTADTSGGWVVRADPVDPTQHALYHSSGAGNVNVGVTAGFKKKLPITDKQIIIGFAMFVPSEYVANVNNSTVPVFRMNATVDTDAAWQAIAITPIYSAKECFRVTNDLSIRWGTDAAQASKKLVAGVVNYLEVRIDPGLVSVWIDDVLVMQKIVSLAAQDVAFIFENNINAGAGGTNMSGNPGRWAINNLYMIINDGIAPTVRLGPTTRVIGSRPETDIDVRFVRPVGALTNASVAGQDLVDSPSQALQSVNVGDFDTYASTQSGDTIRSMAMVHSVAVKVLASNLEADPHRIKPYTKYTNSGEGADAKTRELALFTGNAANTRTIRAMAIRPSDGSIWVIGDAESIWRSGGAGDITTWSKLRDTGSGVNYVSMMMDTDGSIILSRSDFKQDWVTAGSDVINLGTIAVSTYTGVNVKSADSSRYVRFTGRTDINTVQTIVAPYVASPNYTTIVAPATPVVGGYSAAMKVGTTVLATLIPASGLIVVGSGAMSAAANYVTRDIGDTAAAYTSITHDGAAWLIGASSNDPALSGGPRLRRSTDNGITWSAVTAIGSSVAGAGQVLRFGCSNTANQESMFGGDAGSLVASTDGINWRQLPRLTAAALYAGVVMANGDFLIGGVGGAMLRYSGPGTDTTLNPLAGYSMAFGSAAINPKTGAPWTAAEAADSYFGVRLTT